MHLCQTLGQKKLGEIAAYFNVSHYATVSVTIKRLKDDMESDRALVQRIHAIEARLQ
jgi:chromosomal replication initiation ATPase DnaA